MQQPERLSLTFGALADPTRRAILSRLAKGEERERLWRLATTVWKYYDDYAKKTQREIPVVVLERS